LFFLLLLSRCRLAICTVVCLFVRVCSFERSFIWCFVCCGVVSSPFPPVQRVSFGCPSAKTGRRACCDQPSRLCVAHNELDSCGLPGGKDKSENSQAPTPRDGLEGEEARFKIMPVGNMLDQILASSNQYFMVGPRRGPQPGRQTIDKSDLNNR
jgi:hypothetical protein